ncbi:MAG: hypothetical protein QM708_08615 [Propioniciclava sp.]|uniref:hypothetical protein n=1 Tax=Propioniciclava sp. TaxID=2038686 RepID=UPI0039E4D436
MNTFKSSFTRIITAAALGLTTLALSAAPALAEPVVRADRCPVFQECSPRKPTPPRKQPDLCVPKAQADRLEFTKSSRYTIRLLDVELEGELPRRRPPMVSGIVSVETTGHLDRGKAKISADVRLQNTSWSDRSGSVQMQLIDSCGDIIGVTPTLRWRVDAGVGDLWDLDRPFQSVSYSAGLDPRTAALVTRVNVVHRLDGSLFE